MDQVVDTAASDARALVEAGFPALMVENFGDVPFYPDVVPPETVSAMTLAMAAVTDVAGAGVPLGVNVLRNDASAALAIAATTGASLIRVNIFTGTMYTDQGPIVGRAAEVVRKRDAIAPGVEIWADVLVKHATAPPGLDPAQAAEDTVVRGLADAVIVSGTGTGTEPDLEEARAIKGGIPEGTRVVVGSGATVQNLERLLDVADTVIVGSSIKEGGDAERRPDPERAATFVAKAAERGML